jgi:hypothetical protein
MGRVASEGQEGVESIDDLAFLERGDFINV